MNIETTTQIWLSRLEDLKGMIASLNRKAERLGVPGYTLSVGAESVKEVVVEYSDGSKPDRVMRAVVEITISGEYPHLDGWRLVAVNEHDEVTGKNIQNSFPWAHDVVVPVEYRTTSALLCEHCGQERSRRNTYILCNEAGEWKQVGSTCLKSFVGSSDVNRYIGFVSALDAIFVVLKDFIDDDDMGHGGRFLYSVVDIIAVALAAVRVYGWCSRSMAQENFRAVPTSERVSGYMFDKPEFRDTSISVTSEDKEKAAEIVGWVLSIDTDENVSDFVWNLVAAIERDYVDYKKFGLVCAAVSAYNREQSFEAEAAEKLNEYFGNPGERFADKGKNLAGPARDLTIVSTPFSRENYMGTGYQHFNVLQDEDGRTFVMWRDSDLTRLYGSGTTIRVTFKVKGHKEYNGLCQTEIFYAKWEEPDEDVVVGEGELAF